MSGPGDDSLISRLPLELPVFPLEGAVLFPHGHLPLHVFEPRYRNLVEASFQCERMFGMVQPRGTYTHPLPDDAELFETGCAGRIVSFSETEDGRFLVTLKGICRFRISSELSNLDGFRRIVPDYADFEADLADILDQGLDKDKILSAAKSYLEYKGIGCDWSAAAAATASSLVTTFAMTCPFEPPEKQALLECDDVVSRADMLISLFNMAILEGESPLSGARH